MRHGEINPPFQRVGRTIAANTQVKAMADEPTQPTATLATSETSAPPASALDAHPINVPDDVVAGESDAAAGVVPDEELIPLDDAALDDAALDDAALDDAALDDAAGGASAQPLAPDNDVPTEPAAPLEVPRLPLPQSQVTVLQPLTNLKDVVLPTRPDDDDALLATWSAAMENALRDERPADAVRLAHVVLRQLPRHLATYYRLIRAAWVLRRWEEGDAWGRRLLRADPANPLAWRAVAMAAEQRADRARANARWQRAFECDPYEPETRAGLVRTSLDLARLPALNAACLGTLHLRGGRWEQAVAQYRGLVAQDNRRLDYQSGLLIALWQAHTQPEAYEMARRLTQAQPFMLIAWTVVDAVGDADDQALARHPLSTMDPDGDYLRSALVLNAPARPVRLIIKKADRALLAACSGTAHADKDEGAT
jgi:tetratricopeptide (TPR) repeat protein